MALKFNGVDGGDGGVRWYNPETGKIIHKNLEDYELTHECSEIEFSRKVIKTSKRTMSLHPDHVASPNTNGAFYINGICSDENLRITFVTGCKDKLVISRNLVDFMFCSTNQSFTSCFKLDNGTYNKLARFNKTDGFYITYLTQEIGKYWFNGREYEHPKMQGRAWLFESKDHQHFTVGRPYGKSGYELRDALRRWLPNGTEIGWELNESQIALNGEEYDNFDNRENISRHDIYDRTFNRNPLYNDSDINIELIQDYKG